MTLREAAMIKTPEGRALERLEQIGGATLLMAIPLGALHVIFGNEGAKISTGLVIADWAFVLALLCTAIACVTWLVLTSMNSEVRQHRNLSAACLAAMLLVAGYVSCNIWYGSGCVSGYEIEAASHER